VASLTGVTVADLTRYLPGPFASRELLRLGARVVKIELPGGDPMRAAAPGWYAELNRDKEIVAWDARNEAAPDVLQTADVVLEGFRPGVFERLNVALKDTTVLCSITSFGAHGPRAQQAGHDLNYEGYAGLLADTAPAVPPVQIADLAAGGQTAVIEILAALLAGGGARIVVSMTHSSHRFAAHRLAGDPSPRLLTGGAACYRIYETADARFLTVAALEPKFWHRLCELINRTDLVERAFEPELPELDALFRTLADWLALLENEETCVGPVLTLSEAAEEFDPQPHREHA
jgi:crotonobetainyl-CoA:carnitine CoA-transferase CaiB-like acyl-CoA transferase